MLGSGEAIEALAPLSEHALLFRIVTNSFMQRGVNLQFLSAFPGEVEFLYPPLTFLKPTGNEEMLQNVMVGGTPVEYRVIEVTPHI